MKEFIIEQYIYSYVPDNNSWHGNSIYGYVKIKNKCTTCDINNWCKYAPWVYGCSYHRMKNGNR